MFKSLKKLKNHIEDALCNILKGKFSDNTDYTYTTSPRTRTIDITREYPEKRINTDTPIVVIEDSSGDFRKNVIGSRHLRDVTESIFIEGMTIGLTFYSGTTVTIVTASILGQTIPFTVPITVSALGPRVVDDVQNTIIEYLLDEDLVEDSGLVITNIEAMPKGERVIGSDVYKSGGVELALLTCYETTVSYYAEDRIGKITTQPIPIDINSGLTM